MPSAKQNSFSELGLHCQVQGLGRPTMLLHGVGTSPAMWASLASALAGRRVYLPELIGHGRLPSWQGLGFTRPYTVAEEAERLEKILAETAGPLDLIGHSYGGACLLSYALKHPRKVRRLVLIEPTVPYLLKARHPDEWQLANRAYGDILAMARAGESQAAARLTFEYNLGADGWRELPEKAKQRLADSMREVVALEGQAVLGFAPPVEELAALPMPVLLLAGTQTFRGMKKTVESLHRLIPDSRLHWIGGAAHGLPLTHGAEIAREVLPFLAD